MANNILVNFLFAGSSSSLVNASRQAIGSLNNVQQRISTLNIGALTAAGGVGLLVAGLVRATSAAIATSAEFQRLSTSFVSTLAEPLLNFTKGAALTKENLESLRASSTRLFVEAQRAAIDTVATTKEYVTVLQAALAVGQNVGLNQDQILILTKRLVLAAGAFGIEFEKVNSSVAQIFSGSVRVTNQLGRNLGLTTAEARKQLKAAVDSGKLFEFLEQKTRQFSATAKEVANNFLNVKAAISDIFQLGGVAAVKPLFDFLNQELIKFRDAFIGTGGQFFTPALQRIIAGFQQFFKDIIPSLRVLFNEIGKLFSAIGEKANVFSLIARTLINTLTILVQLVRTTGGWVVGIAAVYGVVTRLIPALRTVAAIYELIRARAALAAAASVPAISLGRTRVANAESALGGGGALAVFSRTAGVIGVVIGLAIGLIAVYQTLSGSAETAAEEIEKLNKALDEFSDKEKQIAADTDLRAVISEFKALSDQEHKSIEDQIRLAALTRILTDTFKEVGVAAIKAGKSVDLIAGQSKLNNDLQNRINKLKEFESAITSLTSNTSVSALFGNIGAGEGTGPTDAQVQAEKERQEAVQKSKDTILQLADAIGLKLTPAQLNDNEALKSFLTTAENLRDAEEKRLAIQGLLTKQQDELINQYVRTRDLGLDQLELSKQQSQIQGAFNALLLDQAHNSTLAAKAAAEKSIKTAQGNLQEAETQREANRAVVEAIAIQDTFALSAAQLDAKAKFEDANVRIAQLKANIELYTQAAISFAGKAKTAGAGGGGGSRARDELKDFLTLVDKQLALLKKSADGIDKEATRIIESQRKIIRELADTGIITFAKAFDLEDALIDRGASLQRDLANIQLDLVRKARDLAEAVANRTEADSKKPIGKRGRKPGRDTRDRTIEEVLKLSTDEIDIINKINDEAIKSEESRTEALDREISHRIEIRKLERQDLADAAKVQSDTLLSAQTALAEFGLVSQRSLLGTKFDASQADIDRQRKELLAQLLPLSDDRTADELKDALAKAGISGEETSTSSGLAKLLLAARDENLKRLEELTRRLKEAKDAAAEFDRQQSKTGAKPDAAAAAALAKTTIALSKDLSDISALDTRNQAINEALILLRLTGVTEEQEIQIRAKLRELDAKAANESRENAVENIQLELKQLDIKKQFIDFDLQRIDILEQLNQKQREFGTITELQARSASAKNIEAQLGLIGGRRNVIERQIATSTGRLGGSDNAALVSQILGLQGELHQLGVESFDLKNRLFELRSPFFALKGAFSEIGEAASNLPGPFAKLKGIFDGLSTLAGAIANTGRPKPEDGLLTASKSIDRAGSSFLQKVLQAADGLAQRLGITGDSTSIPTPGVGDIEGSVGVKSAKDGVTQTSREKATSIINAVGSAVSGVLAGIANKDVGQAIAGFGNLAGLIPVAGPFIKAGLEIVGGIVSFFGARAREKTKEMAETISRGIDELKSAISSGAIGLGEGIKALQARVEDARRQLSGRKGGKEELKKIEDDTQAEIKRLREQAKALQDSFRASLEILRQPKALRDVISQIQAINQKAKEFIKSFENPEDALAAIKDAQEFIRLSIQEIKDDIQKTLKDLQDNLRDATEKFAQDQRSILLEGRIDPIVSEAENKRRRLVELERAFQKEKIDLENQIDSEKTKLDFVNKRASIEEKIAGLAERTASALGQAADKLTNAADAMARMFANLNGFGAAAAAGGGEITLNLRVNDQPVGSERVGIDSIRHLEIAGLISPSKGSRFNPVRR